MFDCFGVFVVVVFIDGEQVGLYIGVGFEQQGYVVGVLFWCDGGQYVVVFDCQVCGQILV